MYILSGKTDMLSGTMYDRAADSIKQYLIKRSPEGMIYVSDGSKDQLENNPSSKMEHLTCFVGGMFAYSVITGKSKNATEDTAVAGTIKLI